MLIRQPGTMSGRSNSSPATLTSRLKAWTGASAHLSGLSAQAAEAAFARESSSAIDYIDTCGELRRHLPTEVFLGRPDQLVVHQQTAGGPVMFDPDAHLPRINKGLVYLAACLIAGIRLAREKQVNVRALIPSWESGQSDPASTRGQNDR
jgi:hypothetical protein